MQWFRMFKLSSVWDICDFNKSRIKFPLSFFEVCVISSHTKPNFIYNSQLAANSSEKNFFVHYLVPCLLSYYINDMIHLLKWQLFVLLFILLQMARVLLCSISALSLTACYKEYGVSSETENVVYLKPWRYQQFYCCCRDKIMILSFFG